MKPSPLRTLLILIFVFIGCFGTAYAAAGMLTALPAPAIGGTCGPSTGSETALEALAEPGSIGAGPQPSTSNTAGYRQWETFVHECQSLADHRGVTSLVVFVGSLVVAGVGLIWVLRRPRRHGDDEGSDPTTPEYAPLGLSDPALVGAAAGGGAAMATWPTAPPPAYGTTSYPYGSPPPPYGPPASPYGAPPSPYGSPPPPYGQVPGAGPYPGATAPPYPPQYPPATAYPTAPPPAWTQVPTESGAPAPAAPPAWSPAPVDATPTDAEEPPPA
jgi:hypothetical protein